MQKKVKEAEYRHKIRMRPHDIIAGTVAYELPLELIAKRHEIALTAAFVTHRSLFGLAYSGLQSDYFDAMPHHSGVYVGIGIQTKTLVPGATKPGDIDLLVIPYEHDELMLHRTLALEVKVIRASFLKQGRSPNDYGFTQAEGLMNLGFPYVGVAHLIVSGESPKWAWREVALAKVINENGVVDVLPNEQFDMLPSELMNRAFGRLGKNCPLNGLGLVAAYIDADSFVEHEKQTKISTWFPLCGAAARNRDVQQDLLENVAAFFDKNALSFLDNPRYSREKGASSRLK